MAEYPSFRDTNPAPAAPGPVPVPGPARSDDPFRATHDAILSVQERLFEIELKQAERMADLSYKVAHNAVGLLEVVATASATILGKSAQGSQVSEMLEDLLRKIKEQFGGQNANGR